MLKKAFNFIKNKYFLSLAGNIIMSGLGLVTMTLIYRSLSKSDAGTWVFFQSIVLLVETLRSGFLSTSFIKFYAGASKERSSEVAGSAWVLGLIITACLASVSLVSLTFLKFIHEDGLVLFFKWSWIYYIFSLPWFMATCVKQGEQLFDKLLYIRLSNQGSLILFIIILIISNKLSLLNVVLAFILSNFITSIYVLVKKWTRIRDFKNRTSKNIKELYHFGKYSVGTSLSSNLFSASDTFIIMFMLGKPALAIYNLGQSLLQLVEIPLRSFALTAMPELAQAFNRDNRKEVIAIMTKYAGMLSVLLIPASILGCLLADVPIYIIGGGKYVGTEAANVFRLFLTFAIIYPPDRFFALTLDVIHQPQVNFYKVLVMLAVNIGSDFLGIFLTHNIYGVAFATICPVLTGTIIGHRYLQKYYKFPFGNIFKVGYSESLNMYSQMKGKGLQFLFSGKSGSSSNIRSK